MSYKGPKFEGPRTPQCQKNANPLALCRIASADGARPLNMTSFTAVFDAVIFLILSDFFISRMLCS